MAAAIPDRFSKMNVRYSKAPLSYKTITEIMFHLGKELQCEAELVVAGANVNRIPEIYRQRLSVLRECVIKDGVGTLTRQTFACLEYLTHVGIIFNETFLRRDCYITKDNVDEIESDMKTSLKYFADWRKEQQAFRAASGEKRS